MELQNPFLITGYVKPEYFCDRENETKTIIEAFKNGRNVTLVSQRRMGKTGLIKNVFYELKQQQPKSHFFYIDLFATQDLNHFVTLFADAVLGQLENSAQKAVQQVAKFIKSCRPTFTFNEISGQPKVSLDLVQQQENKTLQEIFEYLNSSKTACYIAFDEFQQVANYPEKGIEALLRSFIQFSPNLHFVFSGSRQHLMQEIFLSPKRPFYQSTQILYLTAIDKTTYYQFANNHFYKQNRALSRSIFDDIYHDFEGHTWYVQMILNRFYASLQHIDNQLYNQIIDTILSENEYVYQSIFNMLPAVSARLLKAIAAEGVVQKMTSSDFIAKHRLKAASSVSRAANFLIKNEYIAHVENGYIVADRFMSLWLAKQK